MRRRRLFVVELALGAVVVLCSGAALDAQKAASVDSLFGGWTSTVERIRSFRTSATVSSAPAKENASFQWEASSADGDGVRATVPLLDDLPSRRVEMAVDPPREAIRDQLGGYWIWSYTDGRSRYQTDEGRHPSGATGGSGVIERAPAVTSTLSRAADLRALIASPASALTGAPQKEPDYLQPARFRSRGWESVNGVQCAVVRSNGPGTEVTTTIWIAPERDFLPLRYRTVVHKMLSLNTFSVNGKRFEIPAGTSLPGEVVADTELSGLTQTDGLWLPTQVQQHGFTRVLPQGTGRLPGVPADFWKWIRAGGGIIPGPGAGINAVVKVSSLNRPVQDALFDPERQFPRGRWVSDLVAQRSYRWGVGGPGQDLNPVSLRTLAMVLGVVAIALLGMGWWLYGRRRRRTA